MPERIIDLRSDTVTQPTQAMRDAMMQAPLGDDVLGDDPTVLELQARCAKIFGKQAACFVPSGSMANQAAIRAHTVPGDEILAHESSHIYQYESGAPAAISGCMFAFMHGERGLFTADDVRRAIRPQDHHFPRSRLLVVENTQNRGGGAVWPIEQIREVTAEAKSHGLRCHLDGARLWNACAATGIQPDEWASHFDTVSTCFSKGLGAPVGSIVVGDEDTIHRIARIRKMLGGAMRQSGLLAAAALHAIDHHRDRLEDDHRRAARLAQALAECPGVVLDTRSVETNIIMFDVPGQDENVLQNEFDSRGIRVFSIGPSRIRAVVSLAVDDSDIDHAIDVMVSVLSNLQPA
ncbi:MAG: low specificity L-threonine aldolase [Phycisphaerae bacterium]|mgnify:CR=1 FL=1|nr:low specificity L-threonine aldolase [Phycisphaerae bacterium]MAT81482.1 low specificity L-threonine aldolase [Phycisphaerae bacterium]